MKKSELKAIIKECIKEEMILEFKGGGPEMKRFIELTDPGADLSNSEIVELDKLIQKYTNQGKLDDMWAAASKAHFGRANNQGSGSGDSLNWFNTKRITKQGKLHKQDVESLKNRIRARRG
jgi:hypothetical protein